MGGMMHSELRAIRCGESESKQALTIVDELALSLDRIGALSDSPESAKDALWEYMSTLQAGQRVMHLRGILSDAVARELGEDAYLACTASSTGHVESPVRAGPFNKG